MAIHGALRSQRSQGGPLPTPFRPYGHASVLQRTPYRARRHAELRSHPVRGVPPGVGLDGPFHVGALEHSAISLGDATAPHMAEDRRPAHPERRRQLRHGGTPAVGGDQVGQLGWYEASQDGE